MHKRIGPLYFHLRWNGIYLSWRHLRSIHDTHGRALGPHHYLSVAVDWRSKNVPLTPSYEDDLIELARSGSRFKSYEHVRFLHSFAVYRWYRALLRRFKNPPKEPAIFGDLQAQGRRYEQQH